MKSKILVVSFLIGIGLMMPSLATAASISYSINPEIIIPKCQSIKTVLNQLKYSNSLARVNLGRNYESILRDVILPINTRLVSNNYNVGKLIELTTQIDQALQHFRQTYLIHEDYLNNTIHKDCVQEPISFYDNLIVIRQSSSNLRKDVEQINSLIKQYQAEFEKLMEQTNEKR